MRKMHGVADLRLRKERSRTRLKTAHCYGGTGYGAYCPPHPFASATQQLRDYPDTIKIRKRRTCLRVTHGKMIKLAHRRKMRFAFFIEMGELSQI